MDTLTIQFKGKRVEQFDGGYGYSIPDIGPQHVITPRARLSSRAQMWISCRDAGIRKTRHVDAFKRAGMDGYSVTESDAETLPNVTVEPIGNGFMARVTVTLDV